MLSTQRPKPTLAELKRSEDKRALLERGLAMMATGNPPELFLGRFLIMSETRAGGQALVQFARGGEDGFFQYAIKCAFMLMHAHAVKP
jgi:hypothetical protein